MLKNSFSRLALSESVNETRLRIFVEISRLDELFNPLNKLCKSSVVVVSILVNSLDVF
jgi:hypothetical protein